jgi:carbamoyl-phosphate synthase large subunit
MIRRCAVDYNVPLITNLQIAKRFMEAIARKPVDKLLIKSWKEYRHL